MLDEHTQCIYCGALATTTDHCPPRALFLRRNWPLYYEFPCCKPCNECARLDEQVLAVLLRFRTSERLDPQDIDEFQKLGQGLKNNQPAIIREWLSLTANQSKNALKRVFGQDYLEKRRSGWGAANLGPLSKNILTRFTIKLTKALYYRHNGHRFQGVLYASQIDLFDREFTAKQAQELLSIAPAFPELKRNNRELYDQFSYRYNHSPEHRVFYAVAQLGEQIAFLLLALPVEMDTRLQEDVPHFEQSRLGRHECP